MDVGRKFTFETELECWDLWALGERSKRINKLH